MGLFSKLVKPVFAAFAAFALSTSGVAAQCSGNPPTYNGLPCATTTRYWDGNLGACGCGANNSPFSWQWESYTAAGSQALFDTAESTWCGSGCGSCYELTPTGQCPTGSPCATDTNPIVVMVTNLCPNLGNEEWCPDHNMANAFGYAYHFDLMDYMMNGIIDKIGWNNPVVTFKRVECGALGSPTCAEAATCECSAETNCLNGGSNTSTPTSAPTKKPTSAPHATAAPTKKPTSAPHATSAPTQKPATAAPTQKASTSGSSSSCRASIAFQQTSAWVGGGMVSITITNEGTSAITSMSVSVPGTNIVSWNLQASSASSTTYTIPSWALPLGAGSSYTSSGYSYTGSQPAAGSVVSVSC